MALSDTLSTPLVGRTGGKSNKKWGKIWYKGRDNFHMHPLVMENLKKNGENFGTKAEIIFMPAFRLPGQVSTQ